MNSYFDRILLTAILICLLVLVFKPNVQPQVINSPGVNIQSPDTIIKLEGDKIAVIDTNRNSGILGTMLIFELDKNTNSFKLIGHSSYGDYFRNPQNYGLFK